MTTWRVRRAPSVGIAVGVVAILIITAFLTIYVARGQEPNVVYGSASDSLPNTTPSDWVTYADHVVVVTPTKDVLLKSPPEDLARGEGIRLRRTTLALSQVVWSRKDAEMKPPETVTWYTVGTAFSDGNADRQVPMVIPGQPRVELGHTYIAAIAYKGRNCTEEPPVPAEWVPLGSGAILP